MIEDRLVAAPFLHHRASVVDHHVESSSVVPSHPEVPVQGDVDLLFRLQVFLILLLGPYEAEFAHLLQPEF